MIHLFMRLSYCKTTYCIAIEIQLADTLCMVYSDVLIDGSLIDAEEKLMLIDRIVPLIELGHLVPASYQPSVCAVY